MSEQDKYLNNGANSGGSGGDERIAFGSMAKGQKKYGSIITPHRLTRSMTEEQPAFLYDVQKDDTMQGIAVKFGVTTEQIRRANQLWTNDSLFLRSKLLIPYSSNSSQDTCNGHEKHHRANQSIGSNISFSEVHIDLHSHNHGGGSHLNTSNISSPQEEMSCTSTVSNSNSKHWTHPLSDSFESEDCTVSPSSVRLETDSSTASVSPYPMNGKSSSSHAGQYNSASNSNNTIWSPNINDCDNIQPHSSNMNEYSSPQSHSTPTSPTARNYFVRDHSEKSAEDFLARIDSAIESKKRQVKLSAENFNSRPWVTFESDSESDQRQTSRTSLRTDGKQLRYSLRKLEKTHDEIFEL